MALDWEYIEKMKERRKKGFSQGDLFRQEDLKLSNVLDGLEEANNEMESNQVPRISESLFKSRYLKAFFGVGESIEDNFAIYLEWSQEISRHFNLPVYVCSDMNINEVLFTVPPITNVQVINPAKADTRLVNSSISMAKEASFLQPLQKDSLMSNALKGIYDAIMDKTKFVTGDQKIWADIYERYKDELKGLPTVGKNKLEAQETSSTETIKNSPNTKNDSYEEIDEGF